jgi:hypothetical protein
MARCHELARLKVDMYDLHWYKVAYYLYIDTRNSLLGFALNITYVYIGLQGLAVSCCHCLVRLFVDISSDHTSKYSRKSCKASTGLLKDGHPSKPSRDDRVDQLTTNDKAHCPDSSTHTIITRAPETVTWTYDVYIYPRNKRTLNKQRVGS